jgi:hypothetical protein
MPNYSTMQSTSPLLLWIEIDIDNLSLELVEEIVVQYGLGCHVLRCLKDLVNGANHSVGHANIMQNEKTRSTQVTLAFSALVVSHGSWALKFTFVVVASSALIITFNRFLGLDSSGRRGIGSNSGLHLANQTNNSSSASAASTTSSSSSGSSSSSSGSSSGSELHDVALLPEPTDSSCSAKISGTSRARWLGASQKRHMLLDNQQLVTRIQAWAVACLLLREAALGFRFV